MATSVVGSVVTVGGLGTPEGIEAFLEDYIPFFASQHGKGDVGDTGIRNEAWERIRNGLAKDMEEALDQLMEEANKAKKGKKDSELVDRIKGEQKYQETRGSRQTKDKKKKKKK